MLKQKIKPPTEVEINEKGEVILYEPGEIPPHWEDTLKRYGIKILKLAMTFGIVVPEFTMRNYIEWAIEKPGAGYETIDVWGVQGSKKSCRCLILSHWVYGDWDEVFNHIILMPDAKELPGYADRGFLQKMKTIDKGFRSPLEVWDDITVQMPSSNFKTNVKQYAAVDSAWAAIRTKITVMLLNNPLIDRLGRNIKDNITMEVFLGPNQVELIERFVRLPGLKHLESNFFKVQVEPLHQFDWRYVPRDVFKQYFELRLEIADFAIHKMGVAYGDEAELQRDLVPVHKAVLELRCSPHTLMSMMSRGLVRTEKVGNTKYINKEDYEKILVPHFSKQQPIITAK